MASIGHFVDIPENFCEETITAEIAKPGEKRRTSLLSGTIQLHRLLLICPFQMAPRGGTSDNLLGKHPLRFFIEKSQAMEYIRISTVSISKTAKEK